MVCLLAELLDWPGFLLNVFNFNSAKIVHKNLPNLKCA